MTETSSIVPLLTASCCNESKFPLFTMAHGPTNRIPFRSTPSLPLPTHCTLVTQASGLPTLQIGSCLYLSCFSPARHTKGSQPCNS